MKNILLIVTGILIIHSINILPQEETHKWKKLDTITGEQLWFDTSFIDTVKGDKFEVWVLKVHKPPMQSDGVDGDIYRSKILYAVNLTTVRYGIMKLRYYDVRNKELYSFDYNTPPPPTDALKYPYPILQESPLYLIIKDVFSERSQNKK